MVLVGAENDAFAEMMMQRQQVLAVGDDVPVTLPFEDGQGIPVVFETVSL